MSKKDLKRTPHHPQKRDDVWWYEENDGIHIIMEKSPHHYEGNEVANHCKITWASLRAALRRKDKE